MMLMLVVLGGIYMVWFGLQRTYGFTQDDTNAQTLARAAMGEMTTSIRTGQTPVMTTNDDLRMVIPYADDHTLVVWMDLAHDPNHDLQLVRYRLNESNQTLYRDTNPNNDQYRGDMTFAQASTMVESTSVINNSANPLFTYWPANVAPLPLSSPVADPTKIGTVTIDLRVDINVNKAPAFHELRSVVQPRNLRQY